MLKVCPSEILPYSPVFLIKSDVDRFVDERRCPICGNSDNVVYCGLESNTVKRLECCIHGVIEISFVCGKSIVKRRIFKD